MNLKYYQLSKMIKIHSLQRKKLNVIKACDVLKSLIAL